MASRIKTIVTLSIFPDLDLGALFMATLFRVGYLIPGTDPIRNEGKAVVLRRE
jgi:hypothetical protein